MFTTTKLYNNCTTTKLSNREIVTFSRYRDIPHVFVTFLAFSSHFRDIPHVFLTFSWHYSRFRHISVHSSRFRDIPIEMILHSARFGSAKVSFLKKRYFIVFYFQCKKGILFKKKNESMLVYFKNEVLLIPLKPYHCDKVLIHDVFMFFVS